MSALRAVDPGEAPEPPKRPRRSRSVLTAAKSGDRRELLVALRDRIARAVAASDCSPRDLAALSRRLIDTAEAIEKLDKAVAAEKRAAEKPPVDESWDAEVI